MVQKSKRRKYSRKSKRRKYSRKSKRRKYSRKLNRRRNSRKSNRIKYLKGGADDAPAAGPGFFGRMGGMPTGGVPTKNSTMSYQDVRSDKQQKTEHLMKKKRETHDLRTAIRPPTMQPASAGSSQEGLFVAQRVINSTTLYFGYEKYANWSKEAWGNFVNFDEYFFKIAESGKGALFEFVKHLIAFSLPTDNEAYGRSGWVEESEYLSREGSDMKDLDDACRLMSKYKAKRTKIEKIMTHWLTANQFKFTHVGGNSHIVYIADKPITDYFKFITIPEMMEIFQGPNRWTKIMNTLINYIVGEQSKIVMIMGSYNSLGDKGNDFFERCSDELTQRQIVKSECYENRYITRTMKSFLLGPSIPLSLQLHAFTATVRPESKWLFVAPIGEMQKILSDNLEPDTELIILECTRVHGELANFIKVDALAKHFAPV